MQCITRRTGKRLDAIALASLLAFGLAACGGSTKTVTARQPSTGQTTAGAAPTRSSSTPASQPTGSSSRTTKAQAAKTYLADVAPANAAIDKMESQFKAATSSTTAGQLAAEAQPVETDLAHVDGELSSLATAYPAAASDLKALISADAVVIEDLAGIRSLTNDDAKGAFDQLNQDLGKLSGAVAVVRGDLGLPQKS
jgi:hypothetical protein